MTSGTFYPYRVLLRLAVLLVPTLTRHNEESNTGSNGCLIFTSRAGESGVQQRFVVEHLVAVHYFDLFIS